MLRLGPGIAEWQVMQAKQRFQAAAQDSRDDVRQRALAGLASLAAKRPAASASQAP